MKKIMAIGFLFGVVFYSSAAMVSVHGVSQKEEIQRACVRAILRVLTPHVNVKPLGIVRYCPRVKVFDLHWRNGEVIQLSVAGLRHETITLLRNFCNECLTNPHQLSRWRKSFNLSEQEPVCLIKVWHIVQGWY